MLQSNIHAKHIYLYFNYELKKFSEIVLFGNGFSPLKISPLRGKFGTRIVFEKGRKGECLLFEAILRIAVFLLMRE